MSAQFRFLVVVLAAVLAVFGITRLHRLPVDVLPEFSPPTIEIQTEALGLSAEEVEQLITVPLEHNLLNGVAWLDTIRSSSLSGLSSITLTFEAGTDLYRARQMVAERLSHAAVTLPRVSTGPVMLQPKSGTSRVLIVRLSSRTLSAIQMSVLARWTITPRLRGVPGVANVATWGMRDRQLQVRVDPERLRAYKVSLNRLLESVGNALWVSTLSFVEAATPGNAGFIDTPQQRLGIQHISPIISPQALSQVSVRSTGVLLVDEPQGDRPAVPKVMGAVRVGDVADVVENHQPLIGDALAADGANLLLVIEKLPGTDTVAVTRGVEDALAALRPGLGGMEIDSTVFRPATFIETARGTITRAAAIAGVAIVLVLGLLLFDWRATLISVVTIPLSLVAAGVVLHMRGATLNIMVVLGLAAAIGVIVADAILVVEHVTRRLRHGPGVDRDKAPWSAARLIREGVREMRGGLLFATPICLLAVLPLLALPALAGAFFQPLALSYALAVSASAAVALIVTPALSAILMTRVSGSPRAGSASPLLRGLEAGHNRLLRWIISRPVATFLAIAVLAGAGLCAIPFVRTSPLLPAFKELDLLVRLEAVPGTSHPEIVRLVNRVAGDVRAIPGVRNVGALVGRAVFGDHPVGINAAELLVNVAATADHGATVGAIEAAMRGYPGLESEVRTYLSQISTRAFPGASAPIVVRVYGQDWTILRSKAEELRRGLSGIAGVTEAAVTPPVEEPTLEVEVDLVAARRHGINPGSIRRAASTLLNGTQVGSLFQEQKVFDVVVWSTPKTRGNLTDVVDLWIDTPVDLPVRLGDLAQVRILPRPSLIRHEDVSRYVDIRIDVTGRDARAVIGDVRRRLREIQFPLEYHATVVGAHEEHQAARNRVLASTAIAVIGILLLLQAALQSWRLALLSFVTLPLALAGGLAACATAGAQSAALGAACGLLAVLGIATRNQLLLFRRLRELPFPALEPVLQGSRERCASIVTTALAIEVALLPVLFMGDLPGLEILRPAVIVMLSGILTATLVDLFVLPALYLRFGPGAPSTPSSGLAERP